MIIELAMVLAVAGTASTDVKTSALEDEGHVEAFQPQGQWRLTTLADGCSVTRDFVRGEDKVTLSIKRIHPGAAVRFSIIGAPITRGSTSLKAGFMPSDSLPRFEQVGTARIGDRDGVVFAGPLLPRQANGAYLASDQTTDFVVVDPRDVRTVLHTRAIDQAEAALDSCIFEKLRSFGVKLEDQQRIVRHTRPDNFADWAAKMQREYPAEALRTNTAGSVAMRLMIDEQGRVAHCHVGNFLAAEVLRTAACNAMIEHARYEPAIDEDGNPVVDVVMQEVRYDINRSSAFSADAHGFKMSE